MRNQAHLFISRIVIIFLLLVPFLFTSEFSTHLSILILIWAILCLSLNIIFGYAGQLSIAHGALFGAGAYIHSVLVMNTGMNFWMALLVTSCLVAFLSILVGMPSLRLRGPFFVIITLGFSVIFVSVIKNLGKITGGVVGLMGIPLISELNIIGISLESKTSIYYFVLACMILIALITYRIKHSSFGKGLIALGEDEDLCKSVGMNTMLFKTKAFVLSSVIASFAGILYASYLGVITPNDASYHQSFDALVYLTVGGVGTIFGSIIGPALMLLISESLQGYGEFRPLVNGLALILLIIFLPKGIAGIVSRFIKVI